MNGDGIQNDDKKPTLMHTSKDTNINKKTSKEVKVSKVPSSRLSRASKIGGFAGGLAINALGQTAKQLFNAQRPNLKSNLLTTNNATSLAARLSEMRGAAMKVGQMLSMDAGEFLPPEWEPILATLRQGGDRMPKSQLLDMLQSHWGHDWVKHFSYFSFEPIASASIGQVHKARLKNGECLAVKVQYPGVADSIHSDVANIARLIKLSGMIPKGFKLDDILAQATEQLQTEADYLQEADYIDSFRQHLAESPHFVLPEVYRPLSNKHILCMRFIEGEPIESITTLSVEVRQQVMEHLFELLLHEIFDFKLVQSDPNFANFQFVPETAQIALLDFGACKKLPTSTTANYKRLALAMLHQSKNDIEAAMRNLQLIHAGMPEDVSSTILSASLMASECLQSETYHFKETALIQRLYSATKSLMSRQRDIEPPDFNIALVNRKVSGMVLLANKMQCPVSLRALVSKFDDGDKT